MEQLAQEFPLDKDLGCVGYWKWREIESWYRSFYCDNGNFKLPEGITEHLEDLNITTLNKNLRPFWVVLREGYWFGSKDLGFKCCWNKVKK